MITPIEAGILIPTSTDLPSQEEALAMAEKIIRFCAPLGLTDPAIPVPTEHRRYVVSKLSEWGFVPDWQDYTSGWSSIHVVLIPAAWFGPDAIEQDRLKRQHIRLTPLPKTDKT